MAAPGGHEEIIATKRQICQRRDLIKKARMHVANIEAHLSRIGAQHVIACTVHGYAEPAHRLARAQADKAAGTPGPLTKADGEKIKRGEMAAPQWDYSRPTYSEIHGLKQHAVHYTALADRAQAYNDHAEVHLRALDPQAVVKAQVADYADPPDITARAQEKRHV